MLVGKLALREWTSLAQRYAIRAVRTIEEIRRQNLLLIIGEHKSIQAVADAIERSHAQVSQWKNRSKRQKGGVSNIDSKSARWIEQRCKKPIGWMDVDHSRLEQPARYEAREPPAPPPNFTDRRTVSDSDWGTLQAVKLVLSEADLERIRSEAERIRKIAAEQVAEVSAADTARKKGQ